MLELGNLPFGVDRLTTPKWMQVESKWLRQRQFVQQPIAGLIDNALNATFGPSLESMATGCRRITIVVSDATRADPRKAMIDAIVERLPHGCDITVAIATGTHGPSDIGALDLPEHIRNIVNHDGHSLRDLVPLGATPWGTRVLLHRCVVEADLVVATGVIRPHYFAGFGAGCKAIFPGMAHHEGIRHNHLLKADATARPGVFVSNRCRDDMEAATRLLRTPCFLLNGVSAPPGVISGFVAGSLDDAFACGARQCGEGYQVARVPPARLVVAADRPPVTDSLYQAAKIAAAVAGLVAPGGLLVIVAPCGSGIGPLGIVNDAIFKTGVLPRLPPGAQIGLLSLQPAEEVALTHLKHVDSLVSLAPTDDFLVVPAASSLIF